MLHKEDRVRMSKHYRKWFTRGCVDYVGKVVRFTPMKDEEVQSSAFREFCAKSGMRLPDQYRMVLPNIQAGFKSAAKYDRPQPVIGDPGAWLLSKEFTLNHFSRHLGGSRIISLECAIQEAERRTSPGTPWNKEFHTKGAMFDSHVLDKMFEDFWTELGCEEDMKMVPIWTNSEKVELRAKEKLLLNKIRTFTASPAEHSISLSRMCFDFNDKFYSSSGKHWSFVGSSKFMRGWHKLYNRLGIHPNAFELDESEYDSSLFAEAMFDQMEIRWEMFSQEEKTVENRRRLERLYEHIVHSVIVLENGELIQKHTGNPSGSANTIVDNTMILFRLFAYAWIVLAKEQGRVISYGDFMNHVEAVLNGDDNTFTVSDECVGWFNPTCIAPVWSSIGVITKTDVWEPRKLSDVSFLSNGFFNHRGVWLPVPNADRVLSSLLWGGAYDDVRWDLLRACALRLDSWGNLELRPIIQSYIEFLWNNYSEQLVGSFHGIDIKSIEQCWKSDQWCWSLYSGLEGGVATSSRTLLKLQQILEFLPQCDDITQFSTQISNESA